MELPDTLVRVRVTDAVAGTLVQDAAVGVFNVGVRLEGRAKPDRGVVALKASTGEHGEVQIPGLPPGRWVIGAASDQGTRRAERTIELREGDSVLVELAVEKGDFTLPYDRFE